MPDGLWREQNGSEPHFLYSTMDVEEMKILQFTSFLLSFLALIFCLL